MLDIFSLPQPPSYYYGLFARTDAPIAKSRKFIDGIKAEEKASKKKFETVPANATIREEHVKCKKFHCKMYPHGPYYYAYWKENGKFEKEVYRYEIRQNVEKRAKRDRTASYR